MSELKRINKYISETGYCSRREADKLISEGLVTINGEPAQMGSKVSMDDLILVENKPLQVKKERVYLAFNKPVGVTCTTDHKDPTNIVDYIGYEERIFPIGRLDKMSEGLIFLTNDGDIVNKILRAGNKHEKEYLVTVDLPVTEEFIQKMSAGVKILDTITQPCKVEYFNKYMFKITLTQGLNRQIRKMCAALNFTVKKLKRFRIMNIELKGIDTGKWRLLDQEEMEQINKMLESSSKTEEASRFEDILEE